LIAKRVFFFAFAAQRFRCVKSHRKDFAMAAGAIGFVDRPLTFQGR
jgi:hypothetical protein